MKEKKFSFLLFFLKSYMILEPISIQLFHLLSVIANPSLSDFIFVN